MVGDLYSSDRTEEKPVILILHGASVFGRKLPLIQALSQEFQELGYPVFAFDARGFGESEKPAEYTPESFDFSQDVRSAIDVLSDREGFANRRFYIVGHSFGGGVALGASDRDSRIEKVVIFGPPRRLGERFLNPEAREKIKLLVRWQGDMQLDRPLEFDLWSQVLAPLNIENYVERFSQPGHTPLFIVDAEDEPDPDLAFLREFYQHTVDPTDYWTVPATNHYLDSGFRLNVPQYYPPTIRSFVEKVDRWFAA
ncbi:MAG: alpha/beta fold hydrolase [Cyanobacteriota bacterium]|nr:alpha/beta fold hydrolase [Cyanobacteriota bacterium]